MEVNANVSTSIMKFREIFPDLELCPYFVDGGIVVQMMNEDLLPYTHFGKQYPRNLIYYVIQFLLLHTW